MDVSVILCTWNNSKRLAITLDALGRCELPRGVTWEIVLVNNNSTDDTSAIAQGFADALPLVYVEEPRQGLSRAKNAGLRVADGGLLIFTDDDVTPFREWVAAYWAAYQERPTGHYFGGPITSEYECGRPVDELLQVAEHSITGLDWGPESRALDDSERFYPANWACPAAAIRAAGEFDTRLGLDSSLETRRVGETFDLMDRLTRLGMSPWYVPAARLMHFVPKTKCTIEFQAQNAEAIGMYSVRAARPHRFLLTRPDLRAWCERRGATIAGIPWPLYVKTAVLAGQWALTRALGRRAYAEYVALRFCLGRRRGYRESADPRQASR